MGHISKYNFILNDVIEQCRWQFSDVDDRTTILVMSRCRGDVGDGLWQF